MSYNIVITILKDKIDLVKRHLERFTINDNKSEHMLISAKNGSVTFNLFKSGKLVLQGTNKIDLDRNRRIIVDIAFDKKEDLTVGFDEVGRSELNGPFVISAVVGYNKELSDIRDSKKTSDIDKAKSKVDKNSLANVIFTINPRLIDKLREKGINLNKMEIEFIKYTKEMLEKIDLEFNTYVDGDLINQDGIISQVKADDNIPVVSSASIIAKSIRDNSKNNDKRESWNIKSSKD